MLAERAGRWKAELLEQGKEQGERRMLQKLLVQKFGELPIGVEQQLDRADESQLQSILQRVLSATQLQDLF